MTENNIDKLYKKAFGEESVLPPEHLWAKIESDIDFGAKGANFYNIKRTNSKRLSLYIASSAAIIAIILSLYLFSDVQHKDDNFTNTRKVAINANNTDNTDNTDSTDKTNTGNNDKSFANIKPLVSSNENTNTHNKSISVGTVENNDAFIYAINIDNKTIELDNSIDYQDINLQKQLVFAINDKKSQKLKEEYTVALNRDVNFEDENITSYHYDDTKKSKHETNVFGSENNHSNKKMHYAIDGQFASLYNSGFSKKTNETKGRSVNNLTKTSAMHNFGTSIRLSMSKNKRIAFNLAFAYNVFGQKSSEEGMYVSRNMALASGNENDIRTNIGKIRSNDDLLLFVADKTLALGSNSKTKAIKADAAQHNTGNEVIDGEKISVEQVFKNIEIPLGIEYFINPSNKLQFSILGGLSGNFMVSNKAYLNYDNDRRYIGKTEDIRKLNFSVNLAVGIKYPLSQRFGLSLEPGFKYMLQSFSSDNNANFKPYTASLSTGIIYYFK